MINQQTPYRSRLARQESKRLAKQTILIVVFIVGFLVLFFTVGIPSLIRLAVALGNAKSTSKIMTQEDVIPPQPPQFDPLPEATSSATISISGFTESGAKVMLEQNGNKAGESVADNQGNFSFPDITLEKGDNNFSAVAVDAAGNKSQISQTQTISYDTEPPKLQIDTPKDKSNVFGLLNQVIDVSGSTDPGAQVTLNDRQLVVTGSGNFSTKFQLNEGDNTLTFKATDPAGNETDQAIAVKFAK